MTASLSRFAVLRIEDDEDEKAASRARDKQRAAAQKLAESKNKSTKVKLNSEKNAAKKMKAAQEKAELKSLAFGGSKPRKSSAPIKKPAGNEVPSNFKEWKQKDQEFVDDDFEAQLKEAIMASKVDFEANIGEVTKLPEQEDVNNKPSNKKKAGNNKNKGTTTMSLDQFKQGPQESPRETPAHQGISGKILEDEHFFEQVADEAKKIINKEKKKNESSKNAKKPKEALQVEQPRLAQLQEELSQKNIEIENLRSENDRLREELLNVKTRNKKLCGILLQGEMKEKAQLLVEMDKISKVKDELTAELESVTNQLQQERSKVTVLTDLKKTATYKKRSDNEK